MGFLDFLFSTKKDTQKQYLEGVNKIKAGVAVYLATVCQKDYARDHAVILAASTTNLVFSEMSSDAKAVSFFQKSENLNDITDVIVKYLVPCYTLRVLICQAVKTRSWVTKEMNPNLTDSNHYLLCVKPIEKLSEFGILIDDSPPNLEVFQNVASDFFAECMSGNFFFEEN